MPDCSGSHLSPLFLRVYSSVSFLCQSGGKNFQISLAISPLSHHTLSGQTEGFVTVTVFSISEDYLSVCALYKHGHVEKSIRGPGNEPVVCLVRTHFPGADGIVVYRSQAQIITPVQYRTIQYNNTTIYSL